MLGWAMWSLAKWRLRSAPREKPRRRRRFLRSVVAIAVVAALAAAWAKRSGGPVEQLDANAGEQGP